MMTASTPKKQPLHPILWWVLFGVATFQLSLCLQSSRAFFLDTNWGNGLHLLGMIALLGLVMGVLMYDSYVKEKHQGKIQRPIRLFEWLYQRQYSNKGGMHVL